MKLDARTATAFDGRAAYARSSPANPRSFFAGRDQLLRRVSVAQSRRSSSAIRSVSCRAGGEPEDAERSALSRRRAILAPSLALGAWFVRSAIASGEDSPPPPPPPPAAVAVNEAAEKEEVIASRIYDATVIGEPMAVGKDRAKVWEKLMNARIVYLGEAEQVPIRDDRDLELEIVRSLKKRCSEIDRPISLALEAFPCDLQDRLDQFMDQRIDGETLKSFMSFWPPERWQEYEPLLSFCRDNGVRLVACGTPLMVLRTVQAEGITALSKADRKLYTPPAGSGFISGFTAISRQSLVDLSYPSQPVPFTPSSYLSAQARVVEDHTMSRIIMEAMVDGGMVVVLTGSSHLTYGTKGTGVPARVSKKIQKKKNQVVILLHPERQQIRREGEVPVADFLWYSAARPCTRNCFDRAEIARVMNAAGRNRDALPQDLQRGLDLGLISPEVLQNFFDLEKNPLISGFTHRYQGFRERLLADPKFLNRLAIEESISITTTLIAQYQSRKENFFEELHYVATDTVRAVVLDFFTVWLPAPTLSFISSASDVNSVSGISSITDLLGSIPDNAFQKNLAGHDWNFNHRLASVIFGGLKLAGVGFIASIGTVASSNALIGVQKFLNPALISDQQTRTTPVLKSAVVYAAFLGISSNLRYQFIAGIVEHRIADEFASQTLFVNMLSFVVRIINSYWATLQWVDLARYTGLQVRKEEPTPLQDSDSPSAALECNSVTDDANVDDIQSPQGENSV